jgi:hypothetical protein
MSVEELDEYIDSKDPKPESLVPGVTWDHGRWKAVKKGSDVRWFRNRIKAEEYVTSKGDSE